MDWLDRMNAAMDYIESNLADEISYDKAAKIACCSTYHFQRMFSFITSVPLSEYIKRRRLTLAAFELQNNGAKVIDVALKYGYEAPEAFSRAFKVLHGITPSSVHGKGVKLKAYPRMSFHISIKGDKEMNYKIEEKSAFTVFGMSRKINRSSIILNDSGDELAAFWGEIFNNGALDKIFSLSPGGNLLAMMWHGENGEVFHYDEKVMPYLIGTFKKSDADVSEYCEINVPAATWAIFPTDETTYDSGKMPEYIRGTCDRIWSEWFPTSGYEHAQLPELEVYYSYDNGQREWCEIWMPVIKK